MLKTLLERHRELFRKGELKVEVGAEEKPAPNQRLEAEDFRPPEQKPVELVVPSSRETVFSLNTKVANVEYPQLVVEEAPKADSTDVLGELSQSLERQRRLFPQIDGEVV